MNKSNKHIGDIAFWIYDLYPYTLWGTITEKAPTITKSYETKEYGKRQYFTPFMVLSPEKAKLIIERLKSIKMERAAVIKIVEDGALADLKELIPNHPAFKKINE